MRQENNLYKLRAIRHKILHILTYIFVIWLSVYGMGTEPNIDQGEVFFF